ncbi:MAG: HAMP domain-containing histidine kinase [Rhodobacteraceae bacterium]|nr:HAMP domain-containing histidine kinase [Paracoccaceae bacterium]
MRSGWRPSLAFVLAGGLAGTLALSFAGLVALRYLGPAIGFRNAELILAAAIALGTGFLGWLQWRLLLRPILALERYAEAHESAATPERPRHFGTRETFATAQRVIAMAEALRDREATIRAHTDHVTHELKTPVSAIRAAVELLEDGGGLRADDRALVAQIDGARAQIEAQLAALRRAAQAREVRYLGAARLGEVLPGLAREFPGLVVDLAVDAPVPLAPEGLRIVLGQLLRNASEHGAARVVLRAGVEPLPWIDVADDGHGVSEGNAGRVFDPFFTTRREQGGTGMGLSVVRNLLEAHRAGIELVPSPSGARFRIGFRA